VKGAHPPIFWWVGITFRPEPPGIKKAPFWGVFLFDFMHLGNILFFEYNKGILL
jgi:hypothetical protein